MNLYLIRHGQSYVNLPDWAEGNTDTALTDLGRRQARALASYFPQEVSGIDTLYASDMARAKETAEALAAPYGTKPTFDSRLREVGNNRLDHTPFPNDALPKDYAEFWGSARPFTSLMKESEGGESWMHFRMRVGQFIEDLVEKHYKPSEQHPEGGTVVAVCHGGVIEAAINHVFNIGHWQHCEVWMRNTGVTRLEYVNHPERESWRLHYLNRIDHLRDL